MLEAPGRLLPRPMSLCLAPAGELAFLIDPIGPGTRRSRLAGARRRDPRLRAARQRLPARRRAAASRRRRHRDRAAALPLAAARLAARRPRLPVGVARAGGRARAERRGGDRPDARHRADRGPASVGRPSSPAAPSRCCEAVRRPLPRCPARLGGADGLRLRRLLRLCRRDRRRVEAALRGRAGATCC